MKKSLEPTDDPFKGVFEHVVRQVMRVYKMFFIDDLTKKTCIR
jgi:hypothetical protein